jgi:predicted component of type VI protein secretion system
MALVSRPKIEFRTDDNLALGEFGIQARTVKAAEGGRAEQADHGNTMVYSTADRVQEPLMEERASRAGRAVLLTEGKRHAIAPGGALIGRSRDCDVVLQDSNVSRRHAEIRPGPQGRWTVADLGSTNGVRVNGRDIEAGHAQPLATGDHLAFGTVDARFEVD